MNIDNEAKEDKAPNAYRIEDDDNLEEKDLKRTFLFGDAKMKSTTDPGMEGQGMGGQNFGNNNLTPAGNDPANPPQNAGEGNAYFRRTQPSEEHPENENFVPEGQEDQQKVGEDYQEGGQQNSGQGYQVGTADDDGKKKFEK